MDLHIENYLEALDNNYVLILTANSVEKASVNSIIRNKKNLDLHCATRGCSIGTIDNNFVVHVTGTSGVYDSVSTGRIAVSILANPQFPKPALIILSGCCWGNPKFVSAGDTIVSTEMCSLNSQKMDKDGISFKSKTFYSFVIDDTVKAELVGISDTIKVGPIGSLEVLYSSTAKRDELLRQHPSLFGGEMEAFGFVPSIDGKVHWLVVKSVSDFGDDGFNRDAQTSAASSSSSHLPEVIEVLTRHNIIDLHSESIDHLALMSTLVGNTITIRRDSFNSDTLNDYLNNDIGPLLLFKLNSYCFDFEYDQGFAHNLCGMLLEAVQNSFKHGTSKNVRITFYCDSITLEEDGKMYDLNLLSGSNGGARAWERLKKDHIDKGDLSYNFGRKNHKFTLVKINGYLRDLKTKCSGKILPSTVGSGFAGGVLDYDRNCDDIYFDVRSTLMMSRQIVLARDIKRVMLEGKGVVLCCRDKQQEEDFRVQLGPDTTKLKIYIL